MEAGEDGEKERREKGREEEERGRGYVMSCEWCYKRTTN